MIGSRLAGLRKKSGLTMLQVSERIGVARSTYAGYEGNNREPDLEKLHKIAELFQTSSDYIIGLTDNPCPKEPTRNIHDILGEQQLHFNGVPLSNEELNPLRDILEMIVRERLDKKLGKKRETNGYKKNSGAN